MKTKRCRTCHEEKPLDAFYTHRGTADGRRSDCKRCFSEHQLQAYHVRAHARRVTVLDLPRKAGTPARDRTDYVVWLGGELQRYAIENHMAVGVSARVNWCVRHECAVERDRHDNVAWCEHCLDELQQEMQRLAGAWRQAGVSMPRAPRHCQVVSKPAPADWEREPIADEFLELLEVG